MASNGWDTRAKNEKLYPIGMKHCPQCKQDKLLEDFAINNNTFGGRYNYCRECMKGFTYRNAENRRAENLKKKYGMTLEEYQLLSEQQGHVCAICGEPEARLLRGKVAPLSVDHCHTEGQVRSLLCSACNQGLGSFRDSPEIMEKAIAYLRQHQATHPN